MRNLTTARAASPRGGRTGAICNWPGQSSVVLAAALITLLSSSCGGGCGDAKARPDSANPTQVDAGPTDTATNHSPNDGSEPDMRHAGLLPADGPTNTGLTPGIA